MQVLESARRRRAAAFIRRFSTGFLAVCTVSVLCANGTQDAAANGDTRTLTIYHTHTRELATVTFRRNGQYDARGLEQLNWLLRDWRRDEPTRMDPRLFDTLWAVYREVGSREPVHVVSAYRSPQTNAMLRRRSSAVAKNSQHMLGKAMDFHLPDVSIERIRAVGMRLQNGGVGYYPSSYTPFIHLDVGSVRAWPRMTRDQLVRLFPDGKTVHIPADGEPLPRYEEARAEVLARGGTVAGYTAYAQAGPLPDAQPRRKSFWATLFGWDEEDEDAEEIRRSRTPTLLARRSPRQAPEIEPVEEASSIETASRPIPQRFASTSTLAPAAREPQVLWQPGAEPQRAESPSARREVALAPMPPRRPEDVATTGALAFAPTPPNRPTSAAVIALASTLPTKVEAASIGIAHPLPPRRPAVPPVSLAALPAPRASATVQPTVPEPAPTRRATRDAPPTERTRGTAGASVKNAAAASPAATAPQPVAPKREPMHDIPRTDRGQLNSLFSAALASNASATKGFANGLATTLPANRFSKGDPSR
ncbi:DUF882 domain-containing protein [Microvirga massiliensis]|uniref:DUF882 domain-containing protein n=1 Tax=Microvirga massiliensis TaxID=1033741 RepID=UPI00093B7E96|nr:DUF882 domain-containing protein [Microvirga massiliensis]